MLKVLPLPLRVCLMEKLWSLESILCFICHILFCLSSLKSTYFSVFYSKQNFL